MAKSKQQVEKEKHCGLGGFAVKKTAACNLFDMKGDEK